MKNGNQVFRILTIVGILSFIWIGKAQVDSIREHCEKIVGDSFALTEVCIQNEQKAKRNIAAMSVDPKILTYCQKIVGDSCGGPHCQDHLFKNLR